MKVLVNKVGCRKCGSIIESKHIHDFKRCSCGSIAIDGGKEYQRLLWTAGEKMDDCIDFSYSVYGDDSK